METTQTNGLPPLLLSCLQRAVHRSQFHGNSLLCFTFNSLAPPELIVAVAGPCRESALCEISFCDILSPSIAAPFPWIRLPDTLVMLVQHFGATQRLAFSRARRLRCECALPSRGSHTRIATQRCRMPCVAYHVHPLRPQMYAHACRTAPSPSRLLGPHPRLPACSKSLRLQCRSAAEPQLSMGAARVKKQPPPPALPPAQQLHSIDLRGSSVVAANGAVILDELRPGVWAEQVLGDMLVLGAETGAPGSSVDVALGRLRCARWLCAARNKMWWMTPEWGATAAQLPPETQVSATENTLSSRLLPMALSNLGTESYLPAPLTVSVDGAGGRGGVRHHAAPH